MRSLKKNRGGPGAYPGDIGRVYVALNEAIEGSNYAYKGIDTVGRTLEKDSAVERFLTSAIDSPR